MLDGRFLSNSFPSGILKHLSTISFSDSLDKLNDQLDVKDEDGNCNLSLFSRLDLDFFFSFCYSVLLFLSLSLLCSLFLFLFIELCHFPCLLGEEVSGFFDILFTGSSYELSPVLSLFIRRHHCSFLKHSHHADLYAENKHLSNFVILFTVLNIYS